MRLAVCAEMMFLDLPITERVKRIAEAGFDAEIWDWTRHDVEDLAATGAMFSSMTGYIRGDFGAGHQLTMLLLWRFYTTVLLTVLGVYLLIRTHGAAAAKELFTVGWFRRR